MHRRTSTWIAWLALAALPQGALADDGRANEALVCRADIPEQDKFAYLRSLSLDLRGVTPLPEEYAALENAEGVPEEVIDGYLQSEEFVERAVRWHRDMLWNNISNITLTNFRTGLARAAGNLWWRRSQSFMYRGAEVTCLNEPATWNPDGTIRTQLVDGANREGYVMVRPYWAPETEIKVCAFDAQETMVTDDGIRCDTSAGFSQTSCGCGPNLNWCRQGDVNRRITQAMATDLEMRVATIIRDNRPYHELFTSRRAYVNGPLVHFWRHMTGVPNNIRYDPLPINVETLPNLAYTDFDTWVEIELPQGHAGILTSTAFLLRFQTNRARANRFFNAFLCQPFTPPSGGLPSATAEELRVLDLQQRHGCKYCHNILEPSAAHWGRWVETGAGYLDPARFPSLRQDCLSCAQTGQGCTDECRRYYLTRTISEEQLPYIGMLRSAEFLREDHLRNVDRGPELLAESTVADNRMPSCMARQAAERLLGRSLLEDEEQWTSVELARSFVQSNYSFRALVKQVVQSPVYRRVR